MQLKTVEIEGRVYAEVQDGNPVYEADGKLLPFDAPHAVQAIKARNAEAKTLREAKEALESRFKAFEGLDPEQARKAVETFANIEAKKLIDAGEVEKFKSETRAAFERQFKEAHEPVVKELTDLKTTLNQERLNAAFAKSKFVAERLAIPADMVQAAFGSRFTPEGNGKFSVKSADGGPILSRSKPGEVAEFDEALEILVDAYPYRDQILKGSGASGGGSGGSRVVNGKRQITRTQFDNLSAEDRARTAREVEIVD